MKKILKLLTLVLLVNIAFVHCKKDDVAEVKPSIDETLAADPELSIFRAALKQVKLTNFADGPGPFTMVVPTNAAFNTFGITEANLASIDSIALTATLLYHVYNGNRTSFEFPKGPNAPLTTLSGLQNFSSVVNGTIHINGNPILTTDIVCGNGRIHKISGVLGIPQFSILGALNSFQTFRLMGQAIAKVGGTTLTAFSPTSTAPITVFGVPNSAFIAAGFDSTAIANANSATITTLGNILRYHIHAGRVFAADMKAGNLRMVQGTNTLVAINGSTTTIKGTNNTTPHSIVAPNLLCSNGVIHRISDVLRP